MEDIIRALSEAETLIRRAGLKVKSARIQASISTEKEKIQQREAKTHTDRHRPTMSRDTPTSPAQDGEGRNSMEHDGGHHHSGIEYIMGELPQRLWEHIIVEDPPNIEHTVKQETIPEHGHKRPRTE